MPPSEKRLSDAEKMHVTFAHMGVVITPIGGTKQEMTTKVKLERNTSRCHKSWILNICNYNFCFSI
jgi:hypothetical protein